MGLSGIGIMIVGLCRAQQGLSYDGSFVQIGPLSTEIHKDMCRCARYPEFVKWTLQWCCMGLDRTGVMIIHPCRGFDKQ